MSQLTSDFEAVLHNARRKLVRGTSFLNAVDKAISEHSSLTPGEVGAVRQMVVNALRNSYDHSACKECPECKKPLSGGDDHAHYDRPKADGKPGGGDAILCDECCTKHSNSAPDVGQRMVQVRKWLKESGFPEDSLLAEEYSTYRDAGVSHLDAVESVRRMDAKRNAIDTDPEKNKAQLAEWLSSLGLGFLVVALKLATKVKSPDEKKNSGLKVGDRVRLKEPRVEDGDRQEGFVVDVLTTSSMGSQRKDVFVKWQDGKEDYYSPDQLLRNATPEVHLYDYPADDPTKVMCGAKGIKLDRVSSNPRGTSCKKCVQKYLDSGGSAEDFINSNAGQRTPMEQAIQGLALLKDELKRLESDPSRDEAGAARVKKMIADTEEEIQQIEDEKMFMNGGAGELLRKTNNFEASRSPAASPSGLSSLGPLPV